jgi:protein-tyrosine phosphatase
VSGELRIDCAPNFRDFGGLPARDGRTVRSGHLFRSEAICDPSDADATWLRRVRLVCDLRGAGERVRAPSLFWRSTGAERVQLDVAAGFSGIEPLLQQLRDTPDAANARALMIATYQALPRASAPALSVIFERLAQGQGPLLVHCTAGKDRTGFVVAMILAALGVAEDRIMADYLVSAARQSTAVGEAARAAAEAAVGGPLHEPAFRVLSGAEPEFLQASLAAIANEFGSTGNYLERAAGLDLGRREALWLHLVGSGAHA